MTDPTHDSLDTVIDTLLSEQILATLPDDTADAVRQVVRSRTVWRQVAREYGAAARNRPTNVILSDAVALIGSIPHIEDLTDLVIPLRGRLDLFTEINNERLRQDELFGEQNHRDGTGMPIYRYAADRYRAAAQRAAAASDVSWRDILLEEVFEALAEKDRGPLRAEVVQIAAVAVAWLEAINRRAPDRGGPPTPEGLAAEVPEIHGLPMPMFLATTEEALTAAGAERLLDAIRTKRRPAFPIGVTAPMDETVMKYLDARLGAVYAGAPCPFGADCELSAGHDGLAHPDRAA